MNDGVFRCVAALCAQKNLVLEFLLVSCSSLESTPLHATEEVSECLLFFPSLFVAILRVCLLALSKAPDSAVIFTGANPVKSVPFSLKN